MAKPRDIFDKYNTFYFDDSPKMAELQSLTLIRSLRGTTWADGSSLSLEEVQRQCYLFTVAGQDTTAALISAVINEILQRPQVHSKVLAEIEACELTSPVVQFDETTRMPYFMACIRETLRIAPPTPIILPRYVSSGGMFVNDIWVPPKTEIAANPYLIHRDERIFGENPDVFRPERWLEDSAQIKLMDKYDFAWGYGSRKCIGKSLALLDAQKFCVQVSNSISFGEWDLRKPSYSENLIFAQLQIRR